MVNYYHNMAEPIRVPHVYVRPYFFPQSSSKFYSYNLDTSKEITMKTLAGYILLMVVGYWFLNGSFIMLNAIWNLAWTYSWHVLRLLFVFAISWWLIKFSGKQVKS